MSTDLRVLKTNQNIQNRFMDLLEQTPFHNISVKMIIEKCQINRSTFYRNYEDKYDLLNRIVENILNDFESSIETDFISTEDKNIEFISEKFEPLISFFNRHRLALEIFTGKELPVNIAEHMLDIFSKKISQRINRLYHPDNDKADVINLLSNMIASNILVSIRWWHLEAHNISKEQLLNIISVAVNNGVSDSMSKQLPKQ